jgi:hypothetical protein
MMLERSLLSSERDILQIQSTYGDLFNRSLMQKFAFASQCPDSTLFALLSLHKVLPGLRFRDESQSRLRPRRVPAINVQKRTLI